MEEVIEKVDPQKMRKYPYLQHVLSFGHKRRWEMQNNTSVKRIIAL